MAKPDNTQQMLRVIINGQSSFRQEVLRKIDQLDQKLTASVDGLEGRVDQAEKNLTERIDKLGRQFAYLEDDTPTREEYDTLEERVGKIEQKITAPIQ